MEEYVLRSGWGGAWSSFVILWRTGSVDRRRQNADQSVACPSRNKAGGFPGGPVVKTPCLHFMGHGFHPWSWY